MGDCMTQDVIAYHHLEPYTAVLAYLGMVSILVAFALETRGSLNSRNRTYLLLMAVGSGILGVRALHTGEWAFLVLEAVWMAVALWAMAQPPVVADSTSDSA